MITGVVLAGGLSQRFGADKAEALYRGRPLIDWSIDALSPYCETIFVSGRRHRDHASVLDRPHSGFGPLGGIAGALFAARELGCRHLLSIPCDTPEVPASLLRQLVESEKPVYAATCPVIGLWPVALAEALEQHLAEERPRAVRHWAAIAGIEAVESPPIPNVNTMADLQQLGGGDIPALGEGAS